MIDVWKYLKTVDLKKISIYIWPLNVEEIKHLMANADPVA